jgi:putative hydrolase of the HAD superfamily
MVPQAILFDLDETLIDRTQSIARYAARFHQYFADRLAPVTVPTITSAMLTADARGYRPREAVFGELAQSLPWRTPPEVPNLRTHWHIWFPVSSVARDGMLETLTTLHTQGIRLGVVSNGAAQRQQPKILHLQIRPYLSTVVVSGAVQIEKPDPRIFALALSEVGCLASQAWFVGDHPVNDVQGAAAAGLRAIWLTGVHAWPPDQPAPRWQISTLLDVVAMVQQERTPAS